MKPPAWPWFLVVLVGAVLVWLWLDNRALAAAAAAPAAPAVPGA